MIVVGYYRLQPEESPKEFEDKCKCGRTLHISNPVLDHETYLDNLDTKNKWNKIWKSRLDERQKERIEKSKSYKNKRIRSASSIPWKIVASIIITLIIYSLFGLIGLLIGAALILILRDC